MIGLKVTLNYFDTQMDVENTSEKMTFSILKVRLCTEAVLVSHP